MEQVEVLKEQGWEYKMEASFIEVYNETLRDLLAEVTPRNRDAGRIIDQNAIKHNSAGEAQPWKKWLVYIAKVSEGSQFTESPRKQNNHSPCIPINYLCRPFAETSSGLKYV